MHRIKSVQCLSTVIVFLLTGSLGQVVLNQYCAVGSTTANGVCVPTEYETWCLYFSPSLRIAAGNCTNSKCCYLNPISTIGATTTATPTTTVNPANIFGLQNINPLLLLSGINNNNIQPGTNNPFANLFGNLPLNIMPNIGNFPFGNIPNIGNFPNIGGVQENCGIKNSVGGGGSTTTPSSLLLTERIVSGKNAGENEFCWNADILTNSGQFLGSGALIKNQWILTSAHILKSFLSQKDSLRIRLGGSSLLNQSNSQILSISNIFPNPGYNPNSPLLENDIALIKLSTPASMTSSCLICLPNVNNMNQANIMCTVAGRGSIVNGVPSGSYPSIQLNIVNVTLVDDATCSNILRSRVMATNFNFHNSYQCAGGFPGQDTCIGDGGAPLACPDQSGRYSVIGVTSWGLGCGLSGIPAVYSKVSVSLPWITQIISQN